MPLSDGFEEIGLGAGLHNSNLQQERIRLFRGQGYKDCSTVCLTLTRGTVDIDVPMGWMQMTPIMNQKLGRVIVRGASIMEGYNNAVQKVLESEDVRWKYILFLEDDVVVPPHTWPRLVESLEQGQYDGVSGLCWTRTYPGQPMIMGAPGSGQYYPQVPQADGRVQPCEAIPLGCTLIKTSLFRHPLLKRPWFRDDCGLEGEPGGRTTVDIYFCHQARKLGATFAVDTGVQVAHVDNGQAF